MESDSLETTQFISSSPAGYHPRSHLISDARLLLSAFLNSGSCIRYMRVIGVLISFIASLLWIKLGLLPLPILVDALQADLAGAILYQEIVFLSCYSYFMYPRGKKLYLRTFCAGTDKDTTSVALQWVMAELINNPGIFKNLRDETNTV